MHMLLILCPPCRRPCLHLLLRSCTSTPAAARHRRRLSGRLVFRSSAFILLLRLRRSSCSAITSARSASHAPHTARVARGGPVMATGSSSCSVASTFLNALLVQVGVKDGGGQGAHVPGVEQIFMSLQTSVRNIVVMGLRSAQLMTWEGSTSDAREWRKAGAKNVDRRATSWARASVRRLEEEGRKLTSHRPPWRWPSLLPSAAGWRHVRTRQASVSQQGVEGWGEDKPQAHKTKR